MLCIFVGKTLFQQQTMKIKITLFLILILVTNLINAQTIIPVKTCQCGQDFDFLAASYITDYSGIQDFSKQNPDYLNVIKKLSNQARRTRNFQKCNSLINKLIKYLNNGHVQGGPTEDNPIYNKVKLKEKSKEGSLEPVLKFLDTKTVLFQIKTADLTYKGVLDSLIEINKQKLDSTEHFIIDLRGNSGGGDAMFSAFIPYLYTNPILIHTTELWATENNIKLFENLLSNPVIPQESKEEIQKIVNKGKENKNSFISITENKTDTIILKEVFKLPNRVSLIIDKECKSATEQFMLLAKQSKKTTIYGYENSGGALDYANLNVVFTPSKFWYATVPTTRTTRLPDNPVDLNGIKPDIFIDRSVKDIVEWLKEK